MYCNPKAKRHTKELAVVNYLKTAISMQITAHDTPVGGNLCLRLRPDILYDCKSFIIIVECDEGQHSQYEVECEEARMHNIVFALGTPTIFIRYNPDGFKINGLPQRVDDQVRLAKLKARVQHFLDAGTPNTPLTVEYLYYDEPRRGGITVEPENLVQEAEINSEKSVELKSQTISTKQQISDAKNSTEKKSVFDDSSDEETEDDDDEISVFEQNLQRRGFEIKETKSSNEGKSSIGVKEKVGIATPTPETPVAQPSVSSKPNPSGVKRKFNTVFAESPDHDDPRPLARPRPATQTSL
jgi:hypothetical protein